MQEKENHVSSSDLPGGAASYRLVGKVVDSGSESTGGGDNNSRASSVKSEDTEEEEEMEQEEQQVAKESFETEAVRIQTWTARCWV